MSHQKGPESTPSREPVQDTRAGRVTVSSPKASVVGQVEQKKGLEVMKRCGAVRGRSCYDSVIFRSPASRLRLLTISFLFDLLLLRPMAVLISATFDQLRTFCLVYKGRSVKTPSLVDAAANGETTNSLNCKTLERQGYRCQAMAIRLSVVLRRYAVPLDPGTQ